MLAQLGPAGGCLGHSPDRTQPHPTVADKSACCFSLLLSFSGLPAALPATPLSMRTWLSARVARFLWSHWAGNPGRVCLAHRPPTRHRLRTRCPRPRQPSRDGSPRDQNRSALAAACFCPREMMAARKTGAVMVAGSSRCPSRGCGPCWLMGAPRPRRSFT